ncbi:hypothetical protein [Costertonia aggregata]|uniref:Lipoprotein n=1 Tax=Costertonia aggregata TaxID=343403 RepID=A0A7H9AM38_9FLAO|nr:hypothetical protein [Costertonia aggregata]QLG44501.1 hypothetical protein HYG79_03780 [Costertonia aggregata]
MKIKVVCMIIVFLFSGCKENSVIKKEINNEFPYSIKFNNDSYLSYTNNVLFERHKSKDTLSNVHFIEFKNDNIDLNTKRMILPSFNKDLLELTDELIILNTRPRTQGKNRKSTDFLTKYDKNLKEVLRKDMDISKYPSGNSFIIGDDDKLFYITDGFKFREKPKLIISEIDDSFNVLNQKIIERKIGDVARCDPVQSIFIRGVGLVVISKLEYRNNSHKHKIEMFDLNSNETWSENLMDPVKHLGYSEKEKKIFIVTEKEGDEISIWDYKGNKQVADYVTNVEPISIISNDDTIFLLEKHQHEGIITKIDFSGKTINTLNIPVKLQADKENITNTLIHRQNQLYLVCLDNFKNLLTVNKIQDK